MNSDAQASFTEREIAEVGAGFADCSLAAERFDHAAHWAAVAWLLDQAPAWQVAATMPGMIRRFNEAKGGRDTDTEGYHETITLASIAAAADAAARAGAAPLHEVVNGILGSEFGRRDWTGRYWSRARLFSVTARKGWCAPDLRPLPFGIYHPAQAA